MAEKKIIEIEVKTQQAVQSMDAFFMNLQTQGKQQRKNIKTY
jgi:hypothetical protein